MEDIRDKGERVTVFGVEYLHLRLPDGDDLYVTEYGLPFVGNLLPENVCTDREWFNKNSIRLSRLGKRTAATSCSYKVRTKPWQGKSIDVVFKWNRMGQDIPGSWDDDRLWHTEFNTPYEEFALLLEMRDTAYESPSRIRTHKPLAIYVPHQQGDLFRLGRKDYKMQRKMDNHDEVDLDMLRSYGVIYEWVKGIDVVEAHHQGLIGENVVAALTHQVEREMRHKGFTVTDYKPQHIIVRPVRDGGVLKQRDGKVAYAMVDFELLQRTAGRESVIKQSRRREYLREQSHRFDEDLSIPLPPHLKMVSIMGVDYIYGLAESTNGALWVVGRNPHLFDYFLPERWRQTPRTKLSATDRVFHTVTKDDIQLVWKVSRVGQTPVTDPFRPEEKRIRGYGYNSPFEEVALSVDLSRKGIPTTYPRAIYVSGRKHGLPHSPTDKSRFTSHCSLRTPEGDAILQKDREYTIIWGFWNKPDDVLAKEDGNYYRALDALQAFREGILSEDVYIQLMDHVRKTLLENAVEDLNFRGKHILISMDGTGRIVTDRSGLPEARICNYDLLRQFAPGAIGAAGSAD